MFFGKKPEAYVPDPPGRTFKRVETGEYFGCANSVTDEDRIAKAKQSKVDQIAALELVPMFVRYTYDKSGGKSDQPSEIASAHVVFQKEVFAEKWNMTHVTEISFTVNHADFYEFEKMSGVCLCEDFRDLTSVEKDTSYRGEERRKVKRGTP